MTVASSSDPPSVSVELFKVVTSDILEHLSYIAHVMQRISLFDVDPFLVLTDLHGPEELGAILIPPSCVKRADLAGIMAAYNMK